MKKNQVEIGALEKRFMDLNLTTLVPSECAKKVWRYSLCEKLTFLPFLLGIIYTMSGIVELFLFDSTTMIRSFTMIPLLIGVFTSAASWWMLNRIEPDVEVSQVGKDWIKFRKQLKRHGLLEVLTKEYISAVTAFFEARLFAYVWIVKMREGFVSHGHRYLLARHGSTWVFFTELGQARQSFKDLYNLVQDLRFGLSPYGDFFNDAGVVEDSPAKLSEVEAKV